MLPTEQVNNDPQILLRKTPAATSSIDSATKDGYPINKTPTFAGSRRVHGLFEEADSQTRNHNVVDFDGRHLSSHQSSTSIGSANRVT